MVETRNVEALTSVLKIGNVGSGDYFEVATAGDPTMHGDGKEWDDLDGDLFGKKIYSNTGKVDTDWDENMMKFQSGGSIATKADRVGWNAQYLHKFATGAVILHPHFHWKQSGTVAFTLAMKWRLIRNGYAWPSWTTINAITCGANDIYSYTSGDFAQITKFASISIGAISLSDILQIQVARIDSNTGDLLVSYIDFHAPVDSMGSKEEYVK